MKVISNYKDFHPTSSSIALTIGYFDGFHLGHQALLNKLKKTAEQTIVFTFENHPGEVLHHTPVAHLTTLSHRLDLFKKMGIDIVILATFTKEFSHQSALVFLTQLRERVPFSHLILGHDAVIGHDRLNDLHSLSHKLGFTVEYLDPISCHGKVVSSREIRKNIEAGKLTEAGELLGRPYSIFADVQKGSGKGGPMGFHTANLPVEKLALPPLGVWAVKVVIDNATFFGVANLGHAPTIHKDRSPCLEVHLFDYSNNLYGKKLEVFFLDYIRPEKKFDTIASLKTQIEKDITHAKSLLTKTV